MNNNSKYNTLQIKAPRVELSKSKGNLLKRVLALIIGRHERFSIDGIQHDIVSNELYFEGQRVALPAAKEESE